MFYLRATYLLDRATRRELPLISSRVTIRIRQLRLSPLRRARQRQRFLLAVYNVAGNRIARLGLSATANGHL